MGHLNGILARVGGNLNNNFQKSQMPGGLPGGGMLKLRFDRYIMIKFYWYHFMGILVTVRAMLTRENVLKKLDFENTFFKLFT